MPGWTLNYEMFFFLIFLIGLALGRVKVVATMLLIALVAAGALVDSADPRLLTWTDPLLLLFLAGMGLAAVWRRDGFERFTVLLPIGIALTIAVSMGWLADGLRIPGYYAAAVTTVAGTLAAQRRWPDFAARPLAWAGDASYSIYLSHTIVMIPLYKALRLLPIEGWPQFLVVTGIVLLVCTALGVVLYHLFERPVIRLLRAYFDRPVRRQAPLGAAPG